MAQQFLIRKNCIMKNDCESIVIIMKMNNMNENESELPQYCGTCLDNRLTQKFKKWGSLISSIYTNHEIANKCNKYKLEGQPIHEQGQNVYE